LIHRTCAIPLVKFECASCLASGPRDHGTMWPLHGEERLEIGDLQHPTTCRDQISNAACTNNVKREIRTNHVWDPLVKQSPLPPHRPAVLWTLDRVKQYLPASDSAHDDKHQRGCANQTPPDSRTVVFRDSMEMGKWLISSCIDWRSPM